MSKNASLVFFSVVICLVGCAGSDSSLEKKFQLHKSEFIQLISRADACLGDKKEKVVWVNSAENLSTEKVCVDLMRSAGLKGFLKNSDGSIQFFTGFFLSNHDKGFFYSESQVEPLLESLDAVDGKGDKVRPYTRVYKSLGDHWYLFYENLNG